MVIQTPILIIRQLRNMDLILYQRLCAARHYYLQALITQANQFNAMNRTTALNNGIDRTILEQSVMGKTTAQAFTVARRPC